MYNDVSMPFIFSRGWSPGGGGGSWSVQTYSSLRLYLILNHTFQISDLS